MTPTPQPQEARPWSPANTDLLRSIAADANFAEWCSNPTMPEFLASAANEIDRLSKLTTMEAEAPVSDQLASNPGALEAPVSEAVEPFAHFQWNGGWNVWEQVVSEAANKPGVIAAYRHPAPSPASAWKPIETVMRDVADLLENIAGSDDVTEALYLSWNGVIRPWREALNEAADAILSLPTPPATEGAGDE